MSNHIPSHVFDFLRDISKNNNREWFAEHKPHYERAREDVVAFADALLDRMNEFDELETPNGKKAVKRIYRDIRFRKDKTPYKTNFGIGFVRATARRRGGYYIHVQPGDCFIGGGFWGPESKDLKRVRQELAVDSSEFRRLIAEKDFVRLFGELRGEKLKTAPQGYAKDHPDIDLLNFKQYLLMCPFTQKEMQQPDFLDAAAETFRGMLPFFDYLSEVLTTDANGESIL